MPQTEAETLFLKTETMDEQQSFFTDSKNAIENYLKNRLLLLKLQSVNAISKLIATMVAVVLMLVFGFFILVFLSITAGYFFAHLTGSLGWGFAIVTGIYILLLILVLVLKKSLQKTIINSIINSFLKSKKNGSNRK